MKALFCIFGLVGSLVFSGCLYSPEVSYTYWRLSESTGMYSPLRSEAPLSADEMRELGLVEKLPENAKTVEAQ